MLGETGLPSEPQSRGTRGDLWAPRRGLSKSANSRERWAGCPAHRGMEHRKERSRSSSQEEQLGREREAAAGRALESPWRMDNSTSSQVWCGATDGAVPAGMCTWKGGQSLTDSVFPGRTLTSTYFYTVLGQVAKWECRQPLPSRSCQPGGADRKAGCRRWGGKPAMQSPGPTL